MPNSHVVITKEQIETAVKEGLIKAFSDPELHCRYSITPGDHLAQHEALKGFMSFTEKINGIKWKTFQSLVIVVVLGLFSLALFGAAIKIKLLTLLGLAAH